MAEMSIVDQVSHSTIRIECSLPGGLTSTGTGFFYSFKRSTDSHVPVIITNKHVIHGALTGTLVFTLTRPDGRPDYGRNHIFKVNDFASCWKPHPDDSIDLCAMPIASIIEQASEKGVKPFFTNLDSSLLPKDSEIEDLRSLEEVTMVGYPNGLWDRVNNLPIFRRGILATSFARDWNGKKEFLIDAACFPGSSGSPVMLVNLGSYRVGTTINIGSRVKLLGVLYAGPQHTVTGEVSIVDIPVVQKPISVTAIPTNLGIVIKAHLIEDFDGVFK
jgi:hypothetical protein